MRDWLSLQRDVSQVPGVRDLLVAGKPREAAAVLGRPWELEGRVEHGDQRGRTIGFPTANLGGVEELMPPHGVYAEPPWARVVPVDGTMLRVSNPGAERMPTDAERKQILVEFTMEVRNEKAHAAVYDLTTS